MGSVKHRVSKLAREFLTMMDKNNWEPVIMGFLYSFCFPEPDKGDNRDYEFVVANFEFHLMAFSGDFVYRKERYYLFGERVDNYVYIKL